jgi:transposase
MKTAERIEARRIRRQEGESIKRIARRLNASVSSVSLWVRDIELSADQRLDVTGLPRSQLSKSIVNVYSKHSQTKRRQIAVRDMQARRL